MRYPWLDEYLMQKPSVTKNSENWNWVRYMIGGKMFLAICLDNEDNPYYITLKADPLEGEILRKTYPDIHPGFYMNKVHWNSIRPDGDVPEDVVRALADGSYRLILHSFSKKKQQEILSGIVP